MHLQEIQSFMDIVEKSRDVRFHLSCLLDYFHKGLIPCSDCWNHLSDLEEDFIHSFAPNAVCVACKAIRHEYGPFDTLAFQNAAPYILCEMCKKFGKEFKTHCLCLNTCHRDHLIQYIEHVSNAYPSDAENFYINADILCETKNIPHYEKNSFLDMDQTIEQDLPLFFQSIEAQDADMKETLQHSYVDALKQKYNRGIHEKCIRNYYETFTTPCVTCLDKMRDLDVRFLHSLLPPNRKCAACRTLRDWTGKFDKKFIRETSPTLKCIMCEKFGGDFETHCLCLKGCHEKHLIAYIKRFGNAKTKEAKKFYTILQKMHQTPDCEDKYYMDEKNEHAVIPEDLNALFEKAVYDKKYSPKIYLVIKTDPDDISMENPPNVMYTREQYLTRKNEKMEHVVEIEKKMMIRKPISEPSLSHCFNIFEH